MYKNITTVKGSTINNLFCKELKKCKEQELFEKIKTHKHASAIITKFLQGYPNNIDLNHSAIKIKSTLDLKSTVEKYNKLEKINIEEKELSEILFFKNSKINENKIQSLKTFKDTCSIKRLLKDRKDILDYYYKLQKEITSNQKNNINKNIENKKINNYYHFKLPIIKKEFKNIDHKPLNTTLSDTKNNIINQKNTNNFKFLTPSPNINFQYDISNFNQSPIINNKQCKIKTEQINNSNQSIRYKKLLESYLNTRKRTSYKPLKLGQNFTCASTKKNFLTPNNNINQNENNI